MESPIAKSYTVHMKRRTLVWFYMLSMQTKRSVKVESKVGSLLNRLIQISWFYASITFLQCNIHRNYGFIRVLSQTPRMGVFIPVHSICSILNPVLCNILSIWMGRQEWISSSLFQRPDVFWFFARPCLYLQRKICAWKDVFALSKVYLVQTFALAKLATYAAMKIPT